VDVTITELTRNDFPLVRPWIDPALFRIFRQPVDDGQLERLLTRGPADRPTDLGYKAVDSAGKPVALAHAVLDWANELAHVQQIVVGDEHLRRQGVGGALMRHVLAACFGHHGLHRVQLFVDEGNDAARAFYGELGFQTDGLMRDAQKIGDRFVGWYCMSLLRGEWDDKMATP